MKPDPRFPDRPTHPDFDDLSAAVLANDTQAVIDDLGEVIGVDMDSLCYMAQNRIRMAATVLTGVNPDHPALMTIYLDAFALGKAFAERRK